jgi:predicted DNA-binding transcriptional regulator YafY
MSRSERLLTVLQILRRHRRPVPAQRIADETRVSLRTIYRDVDALRAQGAVIEGEAGIGDRPRGCPTPGRALIDC